MATVSSVLDSSAISLYLAGKTWLEAPKEAWILTGSYMIINCTVRSDLPTYVTMHWERNGEKINQSGNEFLKEVKLHESIIQLQFLKARSTDAGIYHCLAENEDGKILNSTSLVHVGSRYSIWFSQIFINKSVTLVNIIRKISLLLFLSIHIRSKV